MAQLSKPNREQRRLAENLQQATQVMAAQQLTVQQISGPIPAPDTLREYNDLDPSFANRIISMAEDEAKHRRQLEITIIDAQSHDVKAQRKEIRCGQICALCVALVGFIVGGYAMTHGSPVGGSILSGGTLVSLVGAFLYRHHSSDKTAKPGDTNNSMARPVNPG